MIAPGFYQLFEGHVRHLRNFGIEVMTDQTVTERHTGKPMKNRGAAGRAYYRATGVCPG